MRGAGNVGIDNVSVKEYLGQSVVPESGCGSWLWEPQSTNLITQSELFSDASWTKQNAVITSNSITSPNGGVNADLLNCPTNARILNSTSVTSGVNYTFSIFIKKGTSSLFSIDLYDGGSNTLIYNFDTNVVSGGITDNSIEDYGDGWYRLSGTITTASTTLSCFIYGNGGYSESEGSTYIWGAQLEQQSYATSYIPTDGSTVTRNQDVCNNGGSLASINGTEGTLYFEGAALANDGTFRQISLTQTAGGGDVITLDYSSSSNGIRSYLRVGAVSQSLTYILSDETQYNKIAVRYKDTHSIWVNGLEVASQALTTLPINLNVLTFDNGSGGGNLYGKTKAVAVWKEALSDEELTELTTI